jgi:hypothetical protein
MTARQYYLSNSSKVNKGGSNGTLSPWSQTNHSRFKSLKTLTQRNRVQVTKN